MPANVPNRGSRSSKSSTSRKPAPTPVRSLSEPSPPLPVANGGSRPTHPATPVAKAIPTAPRRPLRRAAPTDEVQRPRNARPAISRGTKPPLDDKAGWTPPPSAPPSDPVERLLLAYSIRDLRRISTALPQIDALLAEQQDGLVVRGTGSASAADPARPAPDLAAQHVSAADAVAGQEPVPPLRLLVGSRNRHRRLGNKGERVHLSTRRQPEARRGQSPASAAEDLLELIMRRYERASTIFSSNRPVDDRVQTPRRHGGGDPLLDRPLHHANVLTCGPHSWRTKLQWATDPSVPVSR